MAVHKPYGGSTAARTIACPAWHSRAAKLPKPPPSYPALLGTALHAILEDCLNDETLDPYVFANQTIEGIEVDTDVITEKVYPALDDIEHIIASHALTYTEPEVFIEHPDDSDVGGTADFIGTNKDETILVVADYKTGDGEMVWAEENAQLMFYAMLVLSRHRMDKLKKVVLMITQPSDRRDHSLDIWETTPAAIKRFKTRYFKAVEQSRKPRPPAKEGEHCKYCPAQALCPEFNAIIKPVLPQLTHLNDLQNTELTQALHIADKLEPWIKAVRKLAHETLERGDSVNGFKLVQKRATRVWADPAAVARRLSLSPKLKTEDCYKTELKSPAQIEKLCKAHDTNFDKLIGDLVSAVSSGTTLAPESDKRPAVQVSAIRQKIAERFQ